VQALSDYMVKILSHADYREKLSQGGLLWAKRFSWEKASEKTFELMEKIVAENKKERH
jgi:glycosyltransferase involved in cell wall biosynthesis